MVAGDDRVRLVGHLARRHFPSRFHRHRDSVRNPLSLAHTSGDRSRPTCISHTGRRACFARRSVPSDGVESRDHPPNGTTSRCRRACRVRKRRGDGWQAARLEASYGSLECGQRVGFWPTLWRLAIDSGCRQGELLALRRLDFVGNAVCIRRSLYERRGERYEKEVKTNDGDVASRGGGECQSRLRTSRSCGRANYARYLHPRLATNGRGGDCRT